MLAPGKCPDEPGGAVRSGWRRGALAPSRTRWKTFEGVAGVLARPWPRLRPPTARWASFRPWPAPGNPLPMPATVHDFRGQSHVRHRAPFAGIPDESRRRVDNSLKEEYTQ